MTTLQLLAALAIAGVLAAAIPLARVVLLPPVLLLVLFRFETTRSALGLIALVLASAAFLAWLIVAHQPLLRARRLRRIGWPAFVLQQGLRQVGQTLPDPGNRGQTISLWDVPAGVIGTRHVRVLIGTNGSPEPDGTHRAAGITVPAELPGPIEAAAWSAGTTTEAYAQLTIRT